MSEEQQITKEEFVRRFIGEMVRLAGETDGNGESVRDYAADVAPAYFDDLNGREVGPEACAESDLDNWEHADVQPV